MTGEGRRSSYISGELLLGSNTVVHLGTAAVPANLNVGAGLDSAVNNNFGEAIGLFDATQGTVNANLHGGHFRAGARERTELAVGVYWDQMCMLTNSRTTADGTGTEFG